MTAGEAMPEAMTETMPESAPAFEEATVETPLGPVWLRVESGALSDLIFIDAHRRSEEPGPADDAAAGSERMRRIAAAVERYFDGDVDALDGIPVSLAGTEFQRAVWDAIRTIPAGETVSYQDIANAVGKHGAARAVGQATGRNPVSIVVPCHRVISSDGSLGGYGGRLDRKEWFLDHERRHANARGAAAAKGAAA